MKERTRSNLVGRRGELMAELFLEELGAEFVARPAGDADLGYDFFVGFKNSEGGMNIAAVELKSTERPISVRYPLNRQLYRHLANTNVPVLLLVADVKQNRLFFALPGSDSLNGERDSDTIPVLLTEVDATTKRELRERLSHSQAVVVGTIH